MAPKEILLGRSLIAFVWPDSYPERWRNLFLLFPGGGSTDYYLPIPFETVFESNIRPATPGT